LVVDDHGDSRDALRQMLEWLGASVCTAANGHEALEQAVLEPPHVVLCDLRMPRMDGFAVLTGLRALLTDRPVRVVAVTGFGGHEDAKRISEAGFDGHLVKPIDYDLLMAAVGAPPARPGGAGRAGAKLRDRRGRARTE
jgi:CheY-like chemotaxis protein